MSRIKNNISIISSDGGTFAYFLEVEDLYSKLSGVKNTYRENMEFIEIGKNIQLNDELLKVMNINLKIENIPTETSHFDKSEKSTPKDLNIETIITVKFIQKI